LDRIGELSGGLLGKQRDLRDARNPHDLAQLTREVQALDRAIDLLVYQLYGLSDAEVELVESNT
jgi:adenine-specific DNA-methyltransferase